MKLTLLYFLTFIAIWLPAISASGFWGGQNDSIAQPVGLLKKYIESVESKTVQLNIINSHNGRYTINTIITTKGDSVQLNSQIKNMNGAQRDTLFHFNKKEFLQKLDRTLVKDNFLKLAGHYQTISIKHEMIESEYRTTEGLGLMNLLEYGE